MTSSLGQAEGEGLLDELFEAAPHPDPYPLYRRLREISPVFRSERHAVVFVTGYAENVELHKNGACLQGQNALLAAADPRREHSPFLRLLPRLTPWIDPPLHTRLRSLFAPKFTPRRIEDLGGFIQARVDTLLDAAEPRGETDLTRDFASLIPAAVICEILGLPAELHGEGLRWARAFSAATLAVPGLGDDVLDAADEAVLAGTGALAAALEERRWNPRADLLSALIEPGPDGERLSDEEAIALSFQLFIAALTTTAGAMSLGLRALLERPEQLRRLREQPQLDTGAVEEILRFDAPVQLNLRRYAHAETAVGETAIAAGEWLVPAVGAANYDPREFAEPERFDVGRAGPSHLTFGRGIHFCVGAPLARLQLRIAIGTVIRRFPQLRLAGEPQLRGTPSLRTLESLPVALGAPRR